MRIIKGKLRTKTGGRTTYRRFLVKYYLPSIIMLSRLRRKFRVVLFHKVFPLIVVYFVVIRI